MSIHVHLERFEGPLGLLLHLIREQEMDIFNINIHHITRQYLEYIKSMRRLDLEVAGEFVAMAATLLHIKSKMLLPQYGEDGEEIKEDPRKELVQKLLEYKKIKELSGELYKLPLLGRDVFTRGEREDVEAIDEGELVLEENPLFSLIASYRTAIKNMKKTVHRVLGELQSISTRIMEISHLLVVGRRLVFNDLITESSNRSNQVLVTFLSLLELAKMGFISVFQTEPFADIHLETKRPISGDIVSQVENYESVNAEQKAQEIMVEAQLSLTEQEPMLEGEDETVVQETFADSASDEDIAAEEARLFAEPEVGPAEMVSDLAADLQIPSIMEQSAGEPTPEAVIESLVTADVDAASLPAAGPETIAIDQPLDAAEPAIPITQNVNSAVNAALSAFAAFDEDEPEKHSKPDEPPTEVES